MADSRTCGRKTLEDAHFQIPSLPRKNIVAESLRFRLLVLRKRLGMGIWPRTFLLAAARKNFSALLAHPHLLTGPQCSLSNPVTSSQKHSCRKLTLSAPCFAEATGNGDLAKNIFTRRRSQKFLGPTRTSPSTDGAPVLTFKSRHFLAKT